MALLERRELGRGGGELRRQAVDLAQPGTEPADLRIAVGDLRQQHRHPHSQSGGGEREECRERLRPTTAARRLARPGLARLRGGKLRRLEGAPGVREVTRLDRGGSGLGGRRRSWRREGGGRRRRRCERAWAVLIISGETSWVSSPIKWASRFARVPGSGWAGSSS